MRLKLTLLALLICLSSNPMQGWNISLGFVTITDQDFKERQIETTAILTIIAGLVAAGYYTQDYWLTPIINYLNKKDAPAIINIESPRKDDNALSKIQDCRARIYKAGEVKTRFRDVAGCQGAKEDFKDIINFLKDPKAFNEMGAKIPKGVLMQGPPGTGKTLLAKAVAGEAGCPFISIAASEFVEAFVGVGAARIRDLFAKAIRLAPCIVFIDEIDAVGKKRSNSSGGGGEEYAQTLAQLLTLMDGFDAVKNPIIIIAATNRAEILDPALTRSGRLDRKVEVGLPFINDRIDILKVHLRNIKCCDDIDIPLLARMTGGFSGAELAQLINEAAILAVNRKSKAVEMCDLDQAFDHVTIGRETTGMERNEFEVKKTAFHESGHAVVMIHQVSSAYGLYKVTITPRGGALGLMWPIPLKEKYGCSHDQLRAEIITLLAGGLAEEEFGYGQWTGKSNDLMKAYRIAYNMVVRYGMSDNLKYLSYDEIDHMLPNDIATKIHEEVQKIVNSCYEECRSLVGLHRNKIEQLANCLMEKGTISGDEVYRMFGLALPDIDFRLS